MIRRVNRSNRWASWTEFRLDEMLHRPDGPAVLDRTKLECSWWLYGRMHRYYGPQYKHIWFIHQQRIK
jgi:hypothetical protein